MSHRGRRRVTIAAAAAFVWLVACGGATTSNLFAGGIVADGGPGNGSALCGPNGTNACPAGSQCDIVLGCVACEQNAQCPADTPYCLLGRCVQCTSDAQCGAGTTPACWPGDHRCHGACITSTNGSSCPPDFPVCTSSGACVQCRASADCPGPTKICNASTQRCVECASNGDCPASLPACLISLGQCVPCLSNANCTDPRAPLCRPDTYTCASGCTADAQCPTSSPHCNLASARCVQCTSDMDCGGTATPYCGTGMGESPLGKCVQCVQNSQCPSATPRCALGTCH